MVNPAGDGLGFCEALLLQPVRHRKRAGPVMAKNGDRLILVQLLKGPSRDLVHRHELRTVDVRGLVLPWFANVEQKGRMLAGELLLQLVDGDLKIHDGRIPAPARLAPELAG